MSLEPVDVRGTLQSHPLMRGLGEDGARILEPLVVVRTLAAGSVVFSIGSVGESLFLLIDGVLAVSVPHGGSEKPLGSLSAPDAVGELALVRPGPRRATVRAQTPVTLLEVSRRDIVALQAKRPQMCAKLMMNIVERFAQKSRDASPLFDRLIDQL
jgi:CRP-like cAMP-binding protein